jgi:hypothetical protein
VGLRLPHDLPIGLHEASMTRGRPVYAIARSDATAVYCFFGAQDAINFVKQYARSKVAGLPLYASGFVTEPGSVPAEGDAATGIYNALNYSPDLDNAANREFVAAWSTAFPGRVPTSMVMASYDAAGVLDPRYCRGRRQPEPGADQHGDRRSGPAHQPPRSVAVREDHTRADPEVVPAPGPPGRPGVGQCCRLRPGHPGGLNGADATVTFAGQ